MQVKFWGDLALFTRPEYKSEPHSYSVLTVTAAIGLLEAIFWKPEFEYVIEKITVLNPIRFTTIKRNMGQKRQSQRVVKQWMKNNGIGRYLIDLDRAQRNHTILINPAYKIDFDIRLIDRNESREKYVKQLERRVDRGQYYKQPYFGCREYAAFFSWGDGNEKPAKELAGVTDLGMMPKALHFIQNNNGPMSWRDNRTKEYVKGKVITEFFHATMVNGVINVAQS